jgi:hypothetical protein
MEGWNYRTGMDPAFFRLLLLSRRGILAGFLVFFCRNLI